LNKVFDEGVIKKEKKANPETVALDLRLEFINDEYWLTPIQIKAYFSRLFQKSKSCSNSFKDSETTNMDADDLVPEEGNHPISICLNDGRLINVCELKEQDSNLGNMICIL
jgi:hypothetical protein